MEKDVSNLPVEIADVLELGATLGENRAFGLIAGRCSAAQAAGLHRLREGKLYKKCTPQWGEFCPNYLGMSRRHADELIRLFEEFGPSYFEVSQLTRISAEAYRATAPAVHDKAIHIEGKAPVALIPENAAQVTAAVAELRRAQPKKKVTSPQQTLEALDRQCRELVARFAELGRTEPCRDWTLALFLMRNELIGELRNVRITP